MRRIRILLVWLPTLLRDILSDAVAREPDMEIVATAETRVELETAVRRYQPDVVVTGSPGTDAGAVASDIRQMAPSVVLVAIGQKGDRATLYSPGSDPLEIPDISTDVLLKAIRDHCATKGNTRLPPA
jgi:DNA-binding NarL/FixJ family response regulator